MKIILFNPRVNASRVFIAVCPIYFPTKSSRRSLRTLESSTISGSLLRLYLAKFLAKIEGKSKGASLRKLIDISFLGSSSFSSTEFSSNMSKGLKSLSFTFSISICLFA